jgi:hypothetical protein
VDEAGMADTLSLDTAVAFVSARGGQVRLIGDNQQLAAIGAGGVLRDIVATHGALHLDELMRFTDPVEGELIRRLDFEILDEIVAAYIAACAVQKFQRNFDADNNRKQDLNNDVIRTRADLKAEGVRQSKTNLIYNNLSLARLRSVTRGNRRYR